MLRDRLVCGIRDAHTQRRLLAEPELTFKKAFDLAQASETAEKNAKQLHQQPSPQPVHALSRPIETRLDSIIRHPAIAAVGSTQQGTVTAKMWFATTAIRKDVSLEFAGANRDRVAKQQVRRTGRDRTRTMSLKETRLLPHRRNKLPTGPKSPRSTYTDSVTNDVRPSRSL